MEPKLADEWFFEAREPEDKKKRRETILANTASLSVLYTLLERRKEAMERLQLSDKAYDSPSWPYFQADKVGCIRTLTEVMRLLEFTKES